MMAGVTRSHLRSHRAWLREGSVGAPAVRLFSLVFLRDRCHLLGGENQPESWGLLGLI